MQKKINLFTILSLVLILSSCASLPKTVKAGEALVIGRAEFVTRNFAPYEGYNVNGDYKSGITLTLSDWDSGKQQKVEVDKDGYFYLTKLNPDHQYTFVRADLVTAVGSGAYQFWIQMSPPFFFSPKEGSVLNLGTLNLDLDGAKNWATWNYSNHYRVKENFKNLDEDSEWLDMPIIDHR